MKEFDDFYETLCDYRKTKREHLLNYFQTNDESIKFALSGISITFHEKTKEFLEKEYFNFFGKPDLDDDSIFQFFDLIHSIITFQEFSKPMMKKSEWKEHQQPI